MDLDPLKPPGPLNAPNPPEAWLSAEITMEMAETALREGWGLSDMSIEIVPEGRVNQTFRILEDGVPARILQRLNPGLGADEAMARDWDAAGRSLAKAGLGRPEMVKTIRGNFLHQEGQSLLGKDRPGGDRGFAPDLWRLTVFLEGRTPTPRSAADAKEAAAALGRAHASWNLPAPIALSRYIESGDVTNQRLCSRADFEEAERRYKGHPNLDAVIPELKRGAKAAAALPSRPSFVRIFSARDLAVHRDTKLANFLLGDPVAIIDLDTVGYGDTILDLGELCRSAAGSGGPISVGPVSGGLMYDASLASAALEGYRSTAPDPGKEAYRLLPTVIRAQAVNLARRYLIDSLAEIHFKWDRASYPSLHVQNLSRGSRCLDLAEELLDREFELMSL